MGVPKFFRYTSERYPCLNELVKQHEIPDFDNMYLDMNGIIHNCSHPDDSNPHFRITEEKIFQDIFHYLSILFQIIKPKKLFFMAIDGVAPRAKMNQQRGRRFRSAREAEKLEEEAKAKGETLPTEKRFDSNCITPGTVFMVRLHEQLRYFVKHKMSTDPLWAKVKVILSGHETPGEGEHKIMDYIRWSRSQADYDANTRHCLYGLDADLIMLAVCTHEPHFALLREEVKFGKTTQRATSPEDTNFFLLHLSLLREYLEQEFVSIKDSLPFKYDIENIIDDWVLMGFLVGNDFIPNLPNMHISNDALPLLYSTYMKVLPTLDGYINEAGDLNLARFEVFMQELAAIDKEKFQDTYADLKYFEGKTGRRPNANERREYKPNNDETFNIDLDDFKPDEDMQKLIDETNAMFMDDLDNNEDDDEYEDLSDEDANFEQEFILHKKDYYMNKLDYSKVTDEVLLDQAEGYVRAIQWNLYYYYKGCPSWCWYYPHHYAPYISDIKGFKDLKIEFELGEPFKPFEQLLAVLPAASKQLLPTPFHALMTDEDSPIVHYYPVHFDTDLNGKKNDWEAVVLIPFIDETNLLSAMAPCYQRLTEEEAKRNMHGPMRVYNWTPDDLGPASAPQYFPAIKQCHATETAVWRHELDVPAALLRRGMLPAADRDLLYPGFPTMRHLRYTTSLKKGKVKVFDQPSRNENMIVRIERDAEPSLEDAARDLLGKQLWVGWPHLTRAKVISVSNEKKRLHHAPAADPPYTVEHNAGNLHKQWISERSTIIEHNMNRLGIDLGDVNIIVHAVNLQGYKYSVVEGTEMGVEAVWAGAACGYALQAVVRGVREYDAAPRRRATPAQAFPRGSDLFLLTKGDYYGCLATVVDSESMSSGRVKVQVVSTPEPAPVPPAAANPYRTVNHAAAACGISAQMLSRITGSVLVVSGERNDLPTESMSKINVGLNLKFNKKNQEVVGYSRRCAVSGAWLYSGRCVSLVRQYAARYPQLFDSLAHRMANDIFFESDLWPDHVGEKKPQEVQQWLKSQPHSRAARRPCGSEALEAEELRALADDIDRQLLDLRGQQKLVTLQVKWNLLYKPELHQGNISADPAADFKLYDRVVCVSRHGSVPFGRRGTVTALLPPAASNSVRLADKLHAHHVYQVMFDEPFPGAMPEELFEENRFYRLMPMHLINISYGRGLRRAPAPPPEPYSYGKPNVLRRDTGHSAFASYSPTSDNKQMPVDNRKPANNTVNNQPPPTQDPTQLLRNLLQISQNETDKTKKNNKNSSEMNQNWRNKKDNNNSQPPPASRPAQQPQPQQTNWRKEGNQPTNTVYNNNKQQPLLSHEFINKNYKNNPVIPPFPSFGSGAPFPGPGSTLPLPQFAPPPSIPAVPAAPAAPGAPAGPPPAARGFPKHLPSVDGVVTLGPSWVKTQNNTAGPPAAPPGEGAAAASTPGTPATPAQEKHNPFVPLQVQTSRRRVQQPGAPHKKSEDSSCSRPAAPPPPPAGLQVQRQQHQGPRQQRKKKSRIAANLPFQTE